MKIKLDFITNSSSTAFVVLIPNQFYASDNEMRKLYDETLGEEEMTDEKLFSELPECIESLKGGDNLWTYGGDGCNPDLWNTVISICERHKFILASLDMNGEGNNIIQGIKEEQIEELLINNIDISSMFNMIQRESIDVTEKTE